MLTGSELKNKEKRGIFFEAYHNVYGRNTKRTGREQQTECHCRTLSGSSGYSHLVDKIGADSTMTILRNI